MMSTKRQEGLSARSVQYLHAVLHRALEQARKWELVERNVAGFVDPPRVPKREGRALTVEEARRLLDAVEGNRYEAFYRVALMLGLRRGEALALRWEDVDLEAGTLRVSGTLRRVEGRWEREGTKTHSSQKTLPLPKSCVVALVEHRSHQDQERRLAGSLWVEHGLVFTREDGQPVWFHYVNRHLAKVCKEAGLPSVTPHELRHSAASLLLAQGVDQRTIMKILRRSTIRMTADLYTHIVGLQLRDAMERMDEALG